MSEAKTLWKKLLEVQKAVTYLQRDAQSKAGGRYNYVSSAVVLERIRGEMDTQGLLLQAATVEERLHVDAAYSYSDKKQHFTEVVMEFTWINTDNPEETMTSRWYGQGIDNGEKGPGKAMTYAEKYFLLKFFHIATGDHDDPDAGLQYEQNNGQPTAPAGPPPGVDEDGNPQTLVGLANALKLEGLPPDTVRDYAEKATETLELAWEYREEFGQDDLQQICDRAIEMYAADKEEAEEGEAA